MPKAAPLQPGFSSGEWSPTVEGRVDSERQRTALDYCENYIPKTQGPLIRRPGSKYVADVKDPSKPPALIEFRFSNTQNYVLEFGDKYIRFFTNNAQLTTNSTHFKVSGTHGTANVSYTSACFFAMRSSPIARPHETILSSSVILASSILEIASPYAYPDVHDLKIQQKDDTVYIVHSSYPEYKLQRFGHLLWDIKKVIHVDGPYMPFNSYRLPNDALRVTIVAGAPSIIYQDGSADYQATTGPTVACSSMVDNGAGLIRVHTTANHNLLTGDRVVIRGAAGTTEANNGTSSISAMFWSILKVGATTFDLVGSAFTNAYTGSGTIYPALFEPFQTNTDWSDVGRTIGLIRNSDSGRSWGVITRVRDMSRADFHIPAASPSLIGSSTSGIILTWQMGRWSRLNGFPNAIAFHQDRKFLAGAPAFPQEIVGSMVGEYENYQTSGSSLLVADNHAIQRTLLSEQVNQIVWMRTDSQGLLAGAANAEWKISPSNQSAALTPSNFNAAETGGFGSHNASPVKAGEGVLYIQNGQQRVREMNYFFQVDTYRSTDMAELADHMAGPGIKKLSVQRETVPVVWVLREDGQLRSMSYGRDDQTLQVGWARQTLGGQSDSAGSAPVVQSMATIPEPNGKFDQLWMAVKRRINGTSVVSVEYLTRPFDKTTAISDSFHVDCGVTSENLYSGAPTVTSGTSTFIQLGTSIFSAGDFVRIDGVIGLNSSITDADGVVYSSSLVNGRTFLVGTATINDMYLLNLDGSNVDSTSYSAYVSSMELRKLGNTVTGLTWLKNEKVDVLADGRIHPITQVNSAGVLALEYNAAKVQVGYGYNSDFKLPRQDAGSNDGTAIGKMRRPSRIALLMNNVGEISIGMSFNKLTPLELERADSDSAAPLFSGIKRESLKSDFDFDGKVCVRQRAPLPGMINTATVILEVNDV